MSRTRPYLAEGLDYQGRHPEMAVYDPCDDDGPREDMTAAEAWLLMGIYIASVLITVSVFSFLAGFL